MPQPTVFIGSSTEGLPVAQALQGLLESSATIALWNQGVFELSRTYIESLEAALTEADFALLVLTPDDVTVSRRKEKSAPRDNVLFELGLFIGRIGRERSYFVSQDGLDLKLPSDLLGVTAANYRPGGTLADALAPVAERIAKRIAELGPRTRIDPALETAQAKLAAFGERVCGYWWERVKPDHSSAISFVAVTPDAGTGTIRMEGRAFGRDGAPVANWDTVATCVNVDNRKVFYYWRGLHPDRPNEPYEGFGEFTFTEAIGRYEYGSGVFSDTNLTNISSTTRKAFELRRCSDAEIPVLRGDDAQRIARAVVKRLKAMG